MKTKQQLIEDFQVLVEKRNNLFKEVKDLECLGEYKQVIDREMELIDIEKYFLWAIILVVIELIVLCIYRHFIK